MVEEIIQRKRLLLGKLDSLGITAENKRREWAKVAQAVPAVGGMTRDSESVKKKWADFKSHVKKKGAERSRELRKTGGGSSNVHLDPLEEKVVGVLIGETLVEGVRGGVDTGATVTDVEEQAGTSVVLNLIPVEPQEIYAEVVDRQLLSEIVLLGKVQEQLLEVEKEKLIIAKEKLELKKKEF
ncbi:uncharacterized protein LKV04_022593 [Tautogolabrus adspersus]